MGQRGAILAKILKKNGYYHFSRSAGGGNPQQTLVHRFVWEYFNGPIEKGLTVDHIDGNKLNNHIDNLQLLARGENSRKSNRQLTDEQVMQIRARRPHESGAKLAREFGVSQQNICDIYKGRHYKHLMESK